MTLGAGQWAVLVVVWAGVWVVGVQGQADGSFWWLDRSTSSPTPSPDAAASPPSVSGRIKANCQCVPFYQCVDGVITTSGVGIIDIRGNVGNASKPVTNVENCPQLLDICCGLPDGSGPPGVTPPTGTTTTLPPDTPCTCVPLIECNDPNRLVSDGKGNTSLALFDIRVSHSKCRGAFEVCCADEPTAKPLEEREECICVSQDLCGPDGHVITDGAGILNPRFGPGGSPTAPLPSGFCPNRQDVCCLPPPGTTTPAPTPSHASCGWRNVGGVRVSVFLALVCGWLCGRW